MRSPDAALSWLEQQRASGSTAWHNMCESLCRQAYGLPAHFSSAELHAKAIPSAFRHGHDTPSRGDLVLYLNGGAGHIVVATGNGWECYTNDYGGRGKVTKADARNLVSWCRASSWFVADAWWSSTNVVRTHDREDDDVALSDDDARKVANAVWDKAYTDPVVGDKVSAAHILVQRVNRNAAAAAQPGEPLPPATGGGAVALTDTDVERIAQRTADLLAARLVQ